MPKDTEINQGFNANSEPDKLATLSDEHFESLRKRMRVVRAILALPDRTRAKVEAAAKDAGVHPATVYRDLQRLKGQGTIRDLAPEKRGFPRRRSRLHVRQEEWIRHFLKKEFLSVLPIVQITIKIGDACEAEGLPRPSRAAVIRRHKLIPLRERELRRAGAKAAEKVTPRPGRFEVEHPWDVWQADHTLVDVIVVDQHGRPIRRVWLTVILDVCTRMVVAFYIGLEPPSTIRIATTMDLAVAPKDSWLAARGLDYEWPAYGLPLLVHTDRAKEFTSVAFVRALHNQGVDTFLRPPGRTRYGGHIERLIGTLMGRCRMLPGATFNSPMSRGNYDSKGAARLTITDLEMFFAEQILGVYHNTRHSALGMTPLEAWKSRAGSRNPMVPEDMETFRLDLFPELHRTITRQGIKAFSDEYYSHELGEAYTAGLRGVTVKYDPRDLSRLYVRIPHRGYIEVPYRFEHMGPPPTLWLLKASRRSRVSAGPGEGEPIARRAAEQTRQIINHAASKSGTAARQAERLRLDRIEVTRSRPRADVDTAPTPTEDDAWLGLFGDEQ